jgi:cell division protein FtsW (lipid II flippase)
LPHSIARETAAPLLRRTPVAWPRWVEAGLVAAAIGALLPWFDRVAVDELGRDRRFADTAIAVLGLPDPVLPTLCHSHAALAEPIVRERLCRANDDQRSIGAIDRMPLTLAEAVAHARSAFLAPLVEAQARLSDLRLQQREGLGDLLALANAIEASERELTPFVKHYRLDGADGMGPVPLACAFDMLDGALAPSITRPRNAPSDLSRANAVLLMGAALDGHPAAAALSAIAVLPVAMIAGNGRCGGIGLSDALTQSASLMADARHAPATSLKNEATRALLHSAGWQWAGWMLAGFGLLQLARRSIPPALGVAASLAVWAAAAWLCRVPWPLAGERGFLLGREGAWWFTPPAPFVWWLLATAIVVLAASPWLRKWLTAGPQALSSRVGYPGFVFLTGIGWLLLLDLSANGYSGNRYLALYHQGHLWLGLLIFTVLVFLRQTLGRAFAWCLSVLDAVASAIRWRFGTSRAAIAFALAVLAIVATIGFLLTNMRQLTSEIGRLWIIVGAAWFFFLRGMPLAERIAKSGNSLVSLARYIAPLLFVVLVLVGVMFATHDMGPLLIAGYGGGAFVAASVAMWWYERHRGTAAALATAMTLFVAWIAALTFALFELGSIDDVTAARLENRAAPLASANDQLALVTWFQRATPPAGFGLGGVPWCGYSPARSCAGVPAQIHSDYTFTALVGVFGMAFAWAVTLGCAIWLHRLIRHHGRVTRGEPRLVAARGRVSTDDQAFLSWLAVTWVVLALCQLAVTVAGNLAVLPLTGVTFPFVSYGMTSLALNVAMLALCLHINVPERAANG